MDVTLDCPVVTVTGTNGKGSTCAMLESCCAARAIARGSTRRRTSCATTSACGSAASRRTTPRSSRRSTPSRTRGVTLRSRISSTARWRRCTRSRAPVSTPRSSKWGSGGRLDAVNIVDADVAVVTTIDLDHMDYLGPTRADIAFEKAGIFRAGRPVVCAEPDPPATMIDHARAIAAPLLQIGRDFGYVAGDRQWRYWGPGGDRFGLPIPALARRVSARERRRGARGRRSPAGSAARGRGRDSRRALRGEPSGPVPGASRATRDRPRRRAQSARRARSRRHARNHGLFSGDDRRIRHARRQGYRRRDRCGQGAHRPLVRRDGAGSARRAPPMRCAPSSRAPGSRRRRSARSTTSKPRSPRRAKRRTKLIESSFSDRS